MRILRVIFCVALVLIQEWTVSANSASTRTQSSVIQTSDAGSSSNGNREISASSVLGSMYRKSRQSRCVRCYEDRYGYDDRYRGGYSSRTSDDRNWYYPSSDYDRYYTSNYRDRDDRYNSRSYDRYEPRGYGDRYGDRYGNDRYGSDRYGGERYGDRYADRDRYDERRGDSYKGRYEDAYRDRYYDRYRDRGSDRGIDRDYYDRYYYRYDYRNYRPWDETYRGQSGFDNSGRGYYFAGDENRDGNSRRYLPETGRRCGILVTNCPYDRNDGGPQQAPSRPMENDNRNGSNSNRNNGWNYMNEQDNQHSNRGGNSGSSSGGSNSGSTTDRSRNRDRDRDRDRDQNRNQQSSSYGGRPSRPLGGSYLFDRESNDVNTEDQANDNGNAQTGTEARNDDSMNQQQKSEDAATDGSSADGSQSRMMNNKQS